MSMIDGGVNCPRCGRPPEYRVIGGDRELLGFGGTKRTVYSTTTAPNGTKPLRCKCARERDDIRKQLSYIGRTLKPDEWDGVL